VLLVLRNLVLSLVLGIGQILLSLLSGAIVHGTARHGTARQATMATRAVG
jgi:hypothetical protein